MTENEPPTESQPPEPEQAAATPIPPLEPVSEPAAPPRAKRIVRIDRDDEDDIQAQRYEIAKRRFRKNFLIITVVVLLLLALPCTFGTLIYLSCAKSLNQM
jgi:hypothetical protein